MNLSLGDLVFLVALALLGLWIRHELKHPHTDADSELPHTLDELAEKRRHNAAERARRGGGAA